jgi:hypothetical protein
MELTLNYNLSLYRRREQNGKNREENHREKSAKKAGKSVGVDVAIKLMQRKQGATRTDRSRTKS